MGWGGEGGPSSAAPYIYSSLIVPFKGTPGKEPYSNY